MKASPLDIRPSLPEMRHRIRGTHYTDAPVAGIEMLMHRFVELEEWDLRSAANAFWRLYWPVSRGGHVIFQGTEQVLHPGFLYLISPHTAFDSACSRPFAKWYFHFNVGGLLESVRLGIVRLPPTARMRTLLSRTCPKPVRSNQAAPLAASPLDSLELALLTLRQAIPRFLLSAGTNSRLQRCIAYLDEHLTEKVTLAELARFAGLSVRTLSQQFVAKVGFPPMRYLLELRLNHAMKLLRHTDHTIEHIAEECGFPNRYYFTRMLSKYRRTTPAAFRDEGRNVWRVEHG